MIPPPHAPAPRSGTLPPQAPLREGGQASASEARGETAGPRSFILAAPIVGDGSPVPRPRDAKPTGSAVGMGIAHPKPPPCICSHLRHTPVGTLWRLCRPPPACVFIARHLPGRPPGDRRTPLLPCTPFPIGAVVFRNVPRKNYPFRQK